MRIILAAAVLAVAIPAVTPAAAQTFPDQSDYVCSATTGGGDKEELRLQVDVKNRAWCSSADKCKEIKTIFNIAGPKVILESSQLEVTSYETSIDRASGKYDSKSETGGFSSESHGTCKPAPFTAFPVAIDGSKIRGG